MKHCSPAHLIHRFFLFLKPLPMSVCPVCYGRGFVFERGVGGCCICHGLGRDPAHPAYLCPNCSGFRFKGSMDPRPCTCMKTAGPPRSTEAVAQF